MALHLTIIKAPSGMSLEEDRKTFSAGGIIGRSAKSDWILADPDRFLSSRHCEVVMEAGQYFLVDLSTNGTFVNGSQEPLGRGTRAALNEGDSFDVGDYRFKATIETDSNDFSGSPFAQPSPDAFAQDMIGTDIGFADTPSAAPESMYMSSEYSGVAADIAPDEMKVTDPLIALNIATPTSSAADNVQATPQYSNSPEGDAFIKDGFSGSQEDSADFLHAAADWPEANSEESVIPEDWADDISILGSTPQPQAAPANAYKLPDDDSLIREQKPDEAVAKRPRPVVPRPRPASRPQPPQVKPSRPVLQSRGSTIDRSLIDALGFGHADLSDEEIQNIHSTVGVMMRDTLDGLMQILRSRTSIKNEFRINITTIQPVENNPLKFSANVDEVLENMFLKQSKAYKPPIDAVQESFSTIIDHQVAVIAGIRSAFKSVLAQFDPSILEETFKDSGKAGGMLGGVMKGKLWSAYQTHYEDAVNNMERSFQEFFGDDFVQAYEDQLHKLARARKHDKQGV